MKFIMIIWMAGVVGRAPDQYQLPMKSSGFAQVEYNNKEACEKALAVYKAKGVRFIDGACTSKGAE